MMLCKALQVSWRLDDPIRQQYNQIVVKTHAWSMRIHMTPNMTSDSRMLPPNRFCAEHCSTSWQLDESSDTIDVGVKRAIRGTATPADSWPAGSTMVDSSERTAGASQLAALGAGATPAGCCTDGSS